MQGLRNLKRSRPFLRLGQGGLMGSQRHDVAPAAGVDEGFGGCFDPPAPGVVRRSLKLRPEQKADLMGQAQIGVEIQLAMALKRQPCRGDGCR